MNTETLSLIFGSLAGSAAFWLAYRFVMYNRNTHRSARIFLLLALTIPLLMPQLQQLLTVRTAAYTISYNLPEQIVGKPAEVRREKVSLTTVFAAAYLLVAFALFFRQLHGVLRLQRRFRVARVTEKDGIAVYTETGYGPGSSGRAVFFPDARVSAEILAHEAGHVRLGHRYDLALANILCCVCWINPFVWVLRRELRLVHEFEADAYAASDGIAPEPYARLLLHQSFGLQTSSFSHAFFHHPIKQRIAMLFTKETSRSRRTARIVAAGFAASLISASLLFVQCRQDAAAPDKVSSVEVYKFVDQMPEFNGDMNEYLGKSLQYPDAARKDGAEGRCVIQFVITKDGTVTEPKVVKSSGSELLDNEAMRVVRNMPAWKPGSQKGEVVNVQFALPVTFRLDDEGAANSTSFRDIESMRRLPNAAGNFVCVETPSEMPESRDGFVTIYGNPDAHSKTIEGSFSSPDLANNEPINVKFSIE